ncbi:MAG: ABC transporter permease [Ignavibacteria bacterium]|nr:ABC transporter permease [Ignavibacteria bacterium]
MTPYYLGASGANFSERAGVINISIEGFMNLAAFSFAVFMIFTGSPATALALSLLSNLLFALLFASLTVSLKINQIVTGVGFNLLIAGLTKFLMVLLFSSSSNTPRIEGLPDIPFLKSVPLIGEVLSDTLTLFSILLVFVSGYLLFRTRFGLRLRSAGENPWAAETLGIKVRAYKYYGVLISSVLSALGGIWLVSEQHNYSDGMIAGRGYIALAAMIIGKWKPLNIFYACILFAGFEALEIALQISGADIPTQLIQMLPYLITIFVLVGFIGKTRPPAADGVPY